MRDAVGKAPGGGSPARGIAPAQGARHGDLDRQGARAGRGQGHRLPGVAGLRKGMRAGPHRGAGIVLRPVQRGRRGAGRYRRRAGRGAARQPQHDPVHRAASEGRRAGRTGRCLRAASGGYGSHRRAAGGARVRAGGHLRVSAHQGVGPGRAAQGPTGAFPGAARHRRACGAHPATVAATLEGPAQAGMEEVERSRRVPFPLRVCFGHVGAPCGPPQLPLGNGFHPRRPAAGRWQAAHHRGLHRRVRAQAQGVGIPLVIRFSRVRAAAPLHHGLGRAGR
ncbi:hypothetical protein DSECCO2_584170 [anaerobic digester metagenome]